MAKVFKRHDPKSIVKTAQIAWAVFKGSAHLRLARAFITAGVLLLSPSLAALLLVAMGVIEQSIGGDCTAPAIDYSGIGGIVCLVLGFSVFLVVELRKGQEGGGTGISIGHVKGSFAAAANRMAVVAKKPVTLNGFTPKECATELKSGPYNFSSAVAALKELQHMTKEPIRPYLVEEIGEHIELTVLKLPKTTLI